MPFSVCSIIETYGKDVKPKELEEVLRLEYRSKLLNPKWAQAMASQGSGGAYEISTHMMVLLGCTVGSALARTALLGTRWAAAVWWGGRGSGLSGHGLTRQRWCL